MSSETRAFGETIVRHQQPRSYKMVKLATAVTACGSFLVLSGLTMAVTIIVLILITPLLVLFSPVLIPATITMCLIMAGFVASGGLGTAGLTALSWMYKYYMMTGKQPPAPGPGAGQLDRARTRLTQRPRDDVELDEEHQVTINDEDSS